MELREIIYPKDWTIIQIGKLCKTFTKQTGFDYSNHIKPTLVDKKTDNNVPFIQNKDFNGFKINYLTDYYVPLDVAVRFPMILLNERCLLISISGSIGKVGVFDNKNTAFIGGAVAVGKFHKPLYLDWVKHYLLSNDGQYKLLSKVKAGSHQNLILDDIRKIRIPLPNEAEQQAIANVLSDTDQLIQNLKTLIAKKRTIKQGAMQELLTGKKRLQGFTEDWKTKTIGDIGGVKMCKRIFSFQTTDTGDVPFYKIGTFGKEPDSFISKKLFEEFKNKYPYPKKNEILISASGTIGRTVVYKGETSYYQDSNIVWIDNNEKLVLNQYLYYIYKSISFNTEGSTIKRLYNSLLLSISFLCPSIQEQQAIAQILSDMDAEIEGLEQQLQKTQTLKKGMMQELLTGKIRLVKPVTQEEPKPLAMVAEPKTFYKKEIKPKKHNEHINDAVLIGTMANAFGSEKFPLTRFMYTKVSYLLKRYKEEQDAGYLKKAAGPYKPKTRYGGAEKIALQNRYVKQHISTYKDKKYENFLAGDNVTEAINYFRDWYGEKALQWIQQFKYTKRDQLELWATVDMAMEDLKQDNKPVSFATIKELINNHKEWRPKLKRRVFSDENIKTAINKINQLFVSEN